MFERELVTRETRTAVKGRLGISQWESTKANQHTVKCVCRACNGGWMSDLEVAAKPTIVRMIRGEQVVLDKEQQEAVASWACLKTMIGAYAWRIHPIPDDWLKYFYRVHLPPDGWAVSTARYVGSMLQMFDSYRFGPKPVQRDGEPTTGEKHKNILTSLIVGNLAISVRAVREDMELAVRSNLLPIWPSSTRLLQWPPGIITDATLTNFRQMGAQDQAKPLDVD